MMNLFIRYHLPVYLWAIIIFIGSSLPVTVPAVMGNLSDELCHLIEFAILGFFLARAFKNAKTQTFRKYFLIFAFVIGCLYGISDEYHQTFVPNRDFEVFDLLADFLGSLLGAITYAVYLWKDYRK